MEKIFGILEAEGVRKELLARVLAFRESCPAERSHKERIPHPDTFYYGKTVWEEAIAALLAGRNILLAGPKATGKNILAENLAALFGRPVWNVSFHINSDAASLIGTDSYDGQKVVFREGPVVKSALSGGFAILDEINMARNEALAVLHSALDFRRVIDVPGFELIRVDPAARFIGTMNYGYAGTRDLNEALASRFAVILMP
ncbi:MAG: AAA family ATPase, partial [Lachnospiraceae bacterium]|nr:AAA family ATPase [Lachnospiraceae bacterium]